MLGLAFSHVCKRVPCRSWPWGLFNSCLASRDLRVNTVCSQSAWVDPGESFNVTSRQYRNSHCKDTTTARPWNDRLICMMVIPTVVTRSLYWNAPQILFRHEDTRILARLWSAKDFHAIIIVISQSKEVMCSGVLTLKLGLYILLYITFCITQRHLWFGMPN